MKILGNLLFTELKREKVELIDLMPVTSHLSDKGVQQGGRSCPNFFIMKRGHGNSKDIQEFAYACSPISTLYINVEINKK